MAGVTIMYLGDRAGAVSQRQYLPGFMGGCGCPGGKEGLGTQDPSPGGSPGPPVSPGFPTQVVGP